MMTSYDEYLWDAADDWMTDDWRAWYDDADRGLPDPNTKEEAIAFLDDRIDEIMTIIERIKAVD